MHVPNNIVTISGKINHLGALTEIQFLPVRESSLMHYPKYQVLYHRWPGLLLQMAFCRSCLTKRMNFLALRGINRTAWGTKLLLTAILAHPVDCISSCQILKAQHCCLNPNGCFDLPLATYPPPPPSPHHTRQPAHFL